MSKSWESLKKILQAKGKERGFKAEFARKLGVVPQSVQRYFSDENDTVPGLDQAEKIAEAAGLRWDLVPSESAQPAPPIASEPSLSDVIARLERIEARLSPMERVAHEGFDPDVFEALRKATAGQKIAVRAALGLSRKAENVAPNKIKKLVQD